MSKKTLVIILVCLILLLGGLLCYKFFANKAEPTIQNDALETPPEPVAVKKIKIVDTDANVRPFAVMINNNHEAWPHAGLQDAYLCYEIIVEGGITRILALFNNQTTEKIGSVRSGRHYFIDYVMENDAILTRYGGSPQADAAVAANHIDEINGYAVSEPFWRDTKLKKAYEHTAFTNMEKLNAYASKKGFRTTSDLSKNLLLNYSVDEIDLSQYPDAVKVDTIDIKYSNYHSSSYEYDAENKCYLRSMSKTKHVDAITGKQYTVKNIITYQLDNYSLGDTSNLTRQELSNIGSGSGYYITNGYAIPITWEKTSHSAKTVYKYNGQELDVNDGNTYIQIQPKDQPLEIKALETVPENVQ